MKREELERIYKQGSALRLVIEQCENGEIDARLEIGKLNKQIREIEKRIYTVVEKRQQAQKAIVELFK